LSLLVLPLYIPTLIFGALTITKSVDGLDPLPSLFMLAGLTLFSIVLMPFASAYALKSNLN
jgi:heme exporter protein B